MEGLFRGLWLVPDRSIYHEMSVINSKFSPWDWQELKLGQREQLGSDRGPAGAFLQAPSSPINHTQIKGLSARLMFNLKDPVRRSINRFLSQASNTSFCFNMDDIVYTSNNPLKRWKQFQSMTPFKEKRWCTYIHFLSADMCCQGKGNLLLLKRPPDDSW